MIRYHRKCIKLALLVFGPLYYESRHDAIPQRHVSACHKTGVARSSSSVRSVIPL
jgi:hypothetical protein